MMIYINGEYYKREAAKVSVYDHGLLYGDGLFEGIRIYDHNAFKLEEHIDRLYQGAKAIMLNIGLTKAEMIKAIADTMIINKKENGYIRVTVTRGEGSLGLNPQSCQRATIVIVVDDISLYPKHCYEQGIKVITSSLRRVAIDVVDPRIKTLNYMNNVLAKIEANQADCEEALMLNNQGLVAECTGDNVFMIKNRQLITPSATQGALEGITKQTIMELASSLGLTVVEKSVAVYDLYNADEVFLTGTAAEVIPVNTIDGRVIGDGRPGPITINLKQAYKKLVSQPRQAKAA